MPSKLPKSRSLAANAAAELLQPHVREILLKCADLAKQGDPKSAALVLGYAMGGVRPMGEKVSLPGFAEAPTLAGKMQVLAVALADGKISVEAAASVSRLLDVAARSTAVEELTARLTRLEAGAQARTIEAPTDSPAQLIADIKRLSQPGEELA